MTNDFLRLAQDELDRVDREDQRLEEEGRRLFEQRRGLAEQKGRLRTAVDVYRQLLNVREEQPGGVLEPSQEQPPAPDTEFGEEPGF